MSHLSEAEWAELRRSYEKHLKEQRRQALARLREALSIESQLARLRAVSDEEWQAAVEAERPEAEGAA